MQSCLVCQLRHQGTHSPRRCAANATALAAAVVGSAAVLPEVAASAALKFEPSPPPRMPKSSAAGIRMRVSAGFGW